MQLSRRRSKSDQVEGNRFSKVNVPIYFVNTREIEIAVHPGAVVRARCDRGQEVRHDGLVDPYHEGGHD